MRQIDGGLGQDTLRLATSGMTLDLTTIADALIRGIEVIDLGGFGINSLVLTALDLGHLSTSSSTLRVDGASGDSVTSTGQGWTPGETVTINTIDYNSFTRGGFTLYTHPDITASVN